MSTAAVSVLTAGAAAFYLMDTPNLYMETDRENRRAFLPAYL
jgi:hypothetical protein